jgi:hypothetical protein
MGSKKRHQDRALESLEGLSETEMTIGGDGDDRAPDEAGASAAAHPEEMSAAIEFRITNHVTVKAQARATPAGLVGAAVLLSAILIPVMWQRRGR